MALEHGSHVYIEKPFAVNAAEAEEIVYIANREGRLACVGHNLAFDGAFLRMQTLQKQGKLGKVVHVDAVMSYDLAGPFGSVVMGDPTSWVHRLPGGLPQNNISHPLSLILEFLKDEKPSIYARGFRWRTEKYGDGRDRTFDELRVMISGKQITSYLLFSCRSFPVQLYVIAHGTNCQAIANIDARTLRVVESFSMPGPFRKVEWACHEARQAGRECFRHVRDLICARLHYHQGMNELFRKFYLAVKGKTEMPIPMSEALRATVIMDEIFHQCNENDTEDGRLGLPI
jgi:predicted dehydrogenase